MKKILIIVLIVAVGLSAWFVYKNTLQSTPSDYKNASYTIDGQEIKQLVDGKATGVTYFGNEASGDFNNDGLADVAFIMTQDNGGSGTFYYVVAALNTGNGYHGTNGVLLGDRIAPQTTEFRDGQIIVNYADRKPGEPMTTQPSVGVSKYLKVVGDTLSEVK
jgi:hypothetical protein